MKQFTQIFTIVVITVLMAVYLHSLLQVENQQEQLDSNQTVIDSLININDSFKGMSINQE